MREMQHYLAKLTLFEKLTILFHARRLYIKSRKRENTQARKG